MPPARGLKVAARRAERFRLADGRRPGTKLIHGGCASSNTTNSAWFRVLAEREVMLAILRAHSLALEFVLPHERHLRPHVDDTPGLFLYDPYSGRTGLPSPRGVRLTPEGHGAGLKPKFTLVFAYTMPGWTTRAWWC